MAGVIVPLALCPVWSVVGCRVGAGVAVLVWRVSGSLQVVALLMVVPLLLALGRPIGLAKAALGPAGSARLDAVLDSRPARLVTVPVVSPLLLALVPFLIFFTPWYQGTLQHPLLGSATRLLLLLVGLAVLVPLWEAVTSTNTGRTRASSSVRRGASRAR